MLNSVTGALRSFVGMGSGDRFLSFPRCYGRRPSETRLLLVLERDLQRLPRCAAGDLRAVAPAHQQGGEPSEGLRGCDPPEPRGSRSGQLGGPLLVVIRGPVSDAGRQGRGDADRPESLLHAPAALLAAPESVLRILACEGFVVHEPDPLQPREDVLDLVVLEPSRQEAPFQLPAAPGTHGQEAEGALVAALRVLGLATTGHPSLGLRPRPALRLGGRRGLL